MVGRNIQIIKKRVLVFFLTLSILISSTYLPLFNNLFQKTVYASNNSCGGSTSQSGARVGGVALDQAAVFLANMDDVTGAYYDEESDRIVFMGKTNTSLPEFNKDDLAVAIRAVIFNKTIPAVSIEDGATSGVKDVLYYGGIESTRFGQVLFEADYKMKQYILGYHVNGTPMTSSVPGYKPIYQRYLDKNPTSPASYVNHGRHWILPNDIVLKKDEQTNSFVFDTVTMRVNYAPKSLENDPLYDQAGQEFAVHHTQYYEQFSDESPSYKDAKQLAKIVGVIKWLSDFEIATDFHWAKDYEPTKVTTPSQVSTLQFPISYNGYSGGVSGGVDYITPNDYEEDNGTSESLKTSSESIDAPKEDIHWTFSNNGQSYESVAVAADAFRSLGGYSTSATDLSTDTCGDVNVGFTRSYSSFSGGQNGIGRGWGFMPAQLVDNIPQANGIEMNNCTNDARLRRYKLSFLINGQNETFRFSTSACNYLPDDTAYHSRITASFPSGTRTLYHVKTKDQVTYTFEERYPLTLSLYSLRLIEIKDKNGNKANYSYDSQNRVSSISDDHNHAITLTYNTNNLISKITDWASREVNYTYDAQGNLLTVTDLRGGVTTYTYDENNKLTTIKDRTNNTVVTNTYTPEAKLATQQDAGGVATTFTYDNDSRTATQSSTLSKVRTVKYDSKARILEEIDPLNYITKYTYGPELVPLTITDKRNKTTTNTFDLRGNIVTTTDPNNKTITYEYDTEDRVTKVTDGRYSPAKVTEFTYDTSGNVIEVDEAGKVSVFTYDQFGEMLTKTDPEQRTTTWTRDTFGNPLTEKDEYNNTTTFEYDTVGRLKKTIDANTRTEQMTYDNNDNVLTKVNANGTTTYEYTAEDKVKKVTLPNTAVTQFGYNPSQSLISVTDALNNITEYSYDQYQNLTVREDALNRQTEYQYDLMNRRTKSETPLGKAVDWEYDGNGNITKRIDANNNETLYEYDNLNRLKKITYEDLSTVTYTYDDRGNLLTMVDPLGTTTYKYDTFDRLTEVTDPNNQVITYTYDGSDNIKTITYPGSKTATYAYDDANRLLTITDWNSQQTTYTYYANGLLHTRTFPNGIVSTYVYDNANVLSSLEHVKSGTTVAKFTYVRDSVGNITKVTEEGSYFPTPPPPPGPDLVITDIYATPSTPNSNTNFDVTIKLKNQGNLGTGMITPVIGYYTDPAQPPTYSVNPNKTKIQNFDLDPGEEITITKDSFNFSTAGTHNIWVIADRQQVLAEQNENNNIHGPFAVQIVTTPTSTSTPTPTATPTPTSGPTPTPTPTPSQVTGRDLIVTGVTLVPSSPEEDESFEIRATIKNQGSVSTGASFNVGFYFDRASAPSAGSYDETESTTTLAAGASRVVVEDDGEFDNAGTHNIWVIVDRSSAIAESNEGNNVFGPFSVNVIAYNQSQKTFAGKLLDRVYGFFTSIIPVSRTYAQQQPVQYVNTYAYDQLGQLLNASQSAATKVFEYTYDSVGNRLTSEINNVPSSYTYNNDNQLTNYANTTYTYDNNGNQTSSGGNSQVYDFENRLKTYDTPSSSDYQFIYDGNGNRIGEKVNNTTTKQYVNDVSGELEKVLITKDLQNSTENYYLYGHGLISQGGVSTQNRQYYLEDGRGNIRFVTDSSGNKVSYYDYDPYGNKVGGDTFNDNFLYKGEQLHAGSNLYYMRARYYDPTTGRFISKDPIEGYLAMPQTQNGYNFVYNNPLNLSDPSGEDAFDYACNTVYQYAKNGEQYIGITNDFARRSAEWAAQKGWTIEPIQGLTDLTRSQARAAEQFLIENLGGAKSTGGTLLNKINSISPNNPTYEQAIETGKNLVKAIPAAASAVLLPKP